MIELSELQIALIAIGSVLLLGVIGYNLSKSKKRHRSSIPNADLSKSTEASRFQEPKLGGEYSSTTLTDHKEPSLDSSLPKSNGEMATLQSLSTISAALNPRIDPAIDSVVLLRFAVPISGMEIIAQMASWPKNTPYRYLIEGLGGRSADIEADDQLTWGSIHPDLFYRELQLGIQLANRRGPISLVDLSEFMTRSQSLADALDAEIDLPPVHEVAEQAKSIDEFCLSADIQLGFQLMANMISWDANDVANALQNRGLILSRDGAFFHCYQDDHLIFRVQAEGVNFLRDDLQDKRIKQIHFLLDVPLASIQVHPFIAMLNKANELAIDMDGRLLDDNGQALSEAAIDIIKQHLDGIYDLMNSRDIIPGSISAQRLFS